METLERAAHAAALGYVKPGLFLTNADAVPGEPVPSLDGTWIALAPFERSPLRDRGERFMSPADRAARAARDARLRQRMKLLELLVRVSMTRRYDWQTAFTTARGAGFYWHEALHQLRDTLTDKASPAQAAHVLRWGHPKLLLALTNTPVEDQYPEMLAQLLSGVANDNAHEWRRDAAFRELLDEDEKLWAADAGSAATRHRVVELGIEINSGEIKTSLLHRIMDVLENFQRAQQDRHNAAVACGAAVSIEFRVTTLRFGPGCEFVGNALAEFGDRINALRFATSVRLGVPVQVETRNLQRCLSKMVRARDSVEDGPRVRTLRTLSVDIAASSFASLGAAVRYPCAVRGALDVTYRANDMAAFAAWLAFGVFHVDSASTVSTLRVRMPGTSATVEIHPPYAILSPAWIQVFKRVLSSVVASEDLAPIAASTTSKRGKRKHAGADAAETSASPLDELDLPRDRRVFVTVRAKTKAFAQPNPRSELVAVLAADARLDNGSETGVTRFQVVRKLRAWLALAVPGAGAGWIRAHDVVSEARLPTKLPTHTDALSPSPPVALSRVTSLAWVGGAYPGYEGPKAQHTAALLELLAIIGEPLEELHLPWMLLCDSHVAEILRCCPNLREINLANNALHDIVPLVAAFETGACKITSLSVDHYEENNDTTIQQVARIVELGTATLKHLAVGTTCENVAAVTSLRDALLSPTCAALEYVRLHCIDLFGFFEGEENATSARVRALFADVLATPGWCSRPLAIRSKLALLSVWRRETTTALSQLDRDALSTILHFARTTHKRTVEILVT